MCEQLCPEDLLNPSFAGIDVQVINFIKPGGETELW